MKRISLLALVALLVLAAPAAGQTPPPAPDNNPPTVPQDADSDGFDDASDQCPSVRGTINGCPDTDSDGDGILDRADPCPSVVGTYDGCFSPPPPPPSERVTVPTATSVTAGGVSLRASRRNGPMALTGTAFLGVPQMSVFTPHRLTIWLPKGVTVSSAPAKPCSQSFARSATLTTIKRCAKMFAGRLPGPDDALAGWFAYAGPKQGAKQRLWLRGRGDDELVRFGAGWIEPASGKRTKVTLELGQLSVTTTGLEVFSAPERATAGMVTPLRGKCSGSIRMELMTAQGNASKTFRC